MDGHPASIDGGYARWRHHHHSLDSFLAYAVQEGRLTGTSPPRQKKAAVGMVDVLIGQLELWVGMKVHRFSTCLLTHALVTLKWGRRLLKSKDKAFRKSKLGHFGTFWDREGGWLVVG